MNYILKNENAVYYECGFSCDNEVFLKLGSEAFFITDARYTTEASEVVKHAVVLEGDRRDLLKTVRLLIRKSGIKAIAYNPSEWSVDEFARLSNKLSITFQKKPNFSQQKRIIKSNAELNILRQAAKYGKDAFYRFGEFLQKDGLGIDEKMAHFEAEAIFKYHGQLGLSFSPIVAFGANAAKPHALPTTTQLIQNELVLLDAGVMYQRYCSDRTRTSSFGEYFGFEKEQIFSDGHRQKVYDTVLFAQEAAIKAAKVGVLANEIDKAAREVIEHAGFGKFFIHSTGHGVGLDIHELPVIGARSLTRIEENMVFTIEPGIYLPDEFGVRIEDTVIMTSKGAEVIG
ncbi:MAG: M24 family metallopeptidase [Sulfurospirillaceae bacterium]|nr:M24 family metallopeptidase [Sulfurospirillaceae bacterium]MDD2825591.1 M24 family metallopeptidase [Sulfurospirillaceae bacterium]